MSVFRLIPLGNISTDSILSAHTEIAPGVERVYIIPKAIKITDNYFVFLFLHQDQVR